MAWSGIPPAFLVQVIIRCVTAKAGTWGAFAPHVFCFISENIIFFIKNPENLHFFNKAIRFNYCNPDQNQL